MLVRRFRRTDDLRDWRVNTTHATLEAANGVSSGGNCRGSTGSCRTKRSELAEGHQVGRASAGAVHGYAVKSR